MKSLKFWFGFSTLLLLATIAAYVWNFWRGGISIDPAHWGTFGNYLTFLGPIFSLFALLVLVKTYDEARSQAQRSEEALEQAKKSRREVSIEGMFFHLLRRRDDMIANWPNMRWEVVQDYMETLIASEESEEKALERFREDGLKRFRPLINAMQAVVYVLQTAQQEIGMEQAERFRNVFTWSLTDAERQLFYCTTKAIMQEMQDEDESDRSEWEAWYVVAESIGKQPDEWPRS